MKEMEKHIKFENDRKSTPRRQNNEADTKHDCNEKNAYEMTQIKTCFEKSRKVKQI